LSYKNNPAILTTEDASHLLTNGWCCLYSWCLFSVGAYYHFRFWDFCGSSTSQGCFSHITTM